jgi:tetratricopeptide (TPR) repeat protein
MKTYFWLRTAAIVILMTGASGIATRAQSPKLTSAGKSQTVPVTTKSDRARDEFELGMKQREDLLYTDQGLDSIRSAVKADPHFALAHAAIAYFTTDPAEEKRERALSIHEIGNASHDERLLIRWMNGIKNGQIVPAISAMNDLLSKYPGDKRLANLDSEWLCSGQQNFDRGVEVLERVLKTDPNYFPALNNLAYCYALSGKVSAAPPLMERYVVALPGQPNPQDSYAEILRMAGDFQGALDHYHASLKIDSHFTASQVGLGSTYALMGDEERAREEYVKAVEMTSDLGTKFSYRLLAAMTYFRQSQPEQARKTYLEVAEEACKAGFPVQEAEAHRSMALFNPDPASALRDLNAAEAVLAEKHVLSAADHDTELASILQTRAYIAVHASMLEVAQKALGPVRSMAQTSRNNLIQQSYHAANGAVLLAQGKYADAISELQYDPRNPLSLELLADAQKDAGDAASQQKSLTILAAINDERVETAVAAPVARAALKANPKTTAQSVHIAGRL